MMTVIQPLFIGTTELLLIGGVALLLFGGKKLPEMMRGLGQGVHEFKKGMKELDEPAAEEKPADADKAQQEASGEESKEKGGAAEKADGQES